MSRKERGTRRFGWLRRRLSSGMTRVGCGALRVCSLGGKPTVTPLTPAALLPRVLGALVGPLLLCLVAASRAAWRVVDSG